MTAVKKLEQNANTSKNTLDDDNETSAYSMILPKRITITGQPEN
jgi:hypothetical protein